MRNRRLHEALRAFALDSARSLSADIEAGAEVAFELDERSTGRSVLYRYRPLIATFVSERWQQLRTLDSFRPAADELGSGSAAYLRVQGLAAGARSRPAAPPCASRGGRPTPTPSRRCSRCSSASGRTPRASPSPRTASSASTRRSSA